jgi:hypothetical protein
VRLKPLFTFKSITNTYKIMTRERAKELLPVYTAWIEGKTVMYQDHHGDWREIDYSIGLGMEPSRYKVIEEECIMPEESTPEWFIDMVNEDANPDDDSEYRQYRELPDVPEYIIASISDDACETYVFEATADGKIVSYEEYGGLAERWGDLRWWDAEKAVKSCMRNSYDLVSIKGNHCLFKLVKPDELTHFDGDESDRISY